MLTTTLALAALTLTPGASELPAAEGELVWFDGMHTSAVGTAVKEQKLLLTYFWANTDNCAKLFSETMADEGVIAEMSEMICYSANAGEPQGRKLLERYGLQTVPALLVTGLEGSEEEMMVGFMDARTFINEIQRIKRGENTISNLSTLR